MNAQGTRTRGDEDRSKRRGAWRRRLLIGLGALVVVLGVLAVFAPRIAGGLAPSSMGLSINGHPATLAISGVSLSWSGPQRVRSATLVSDAGAKVADLNLEASTSLLGLVLGGRDLGVVRVSGEVRVSESMLTAPPGAAPAPTTRPAPTPSSRPARAITLPAGWTARLEAKGIKATFEPTAGSGSGGGGATGPIVLEGLDVDAAYLGGRELRLAVKAASPSVDVSLVATDVAGPDGVLTLDRVQAQLNASATVPAALVDALARLALSGEGGKSGAGSSIAAPAGAPTTLSASLIVRGGRLMLADPARPATIEVGVPGSVVSALGGEEAGLALESAPRLTLSVRALDVPVPTNPTTGGSAASAPDWRGAGIDVVLETTASRGTIGGPGAARRVELEPASLRVLAADLARGASLTGGMRGLVDGQTTGALAVDLSAGGLLDERGGLRAGMPGDLRGTVSASGVATSLLRPFVNDERINLGELIGPMFDLKLSASTAPRTDAPSGAASIPATDLVLELASAHLGVWAVVQADAAGVRGTENAVRLEARRPGALLRALAPAPGPTIEGDGLLIATISDVNLPLRGGLPALEEAGASLRASLGNLKVRGWAEGGEAIDVRSLDQELRLSPRAPVVVAIDHRLGVGGGLVRGTGRIELDGLLAGAAPGAGGSGLERVRASGTIELTGVPTSLAGLLPEDLRGRVEESLGQTVGLTLGIAPEVSSQGTDAGAGGAGVLPFAPHRLSLALNGPGVAGRAAVIAGGSSVRLAGEAATLSLLRPGALVQAGAGGAIESIDWTQALKIDVNALEVALTKKGDRVAPSSLTGAASLTGGGLTARVRDAGGVRTLEARSLELTLASSQGGAGRLGITAAGGFDGQAFGVAGALEAQELGAALEAGAMSLRPQGTIRASALPTALAELVSREYAPVLREVLGATMDVELVAPAPGAASSSGLSMGATLTSPGATARTSVTVSPDGAAIDVGETTLTTRLTPRAVELAAGVAAPTLTPAPSLGGPATLALSVQPLRLTKRAPAGGEGAAWSPGAITARLGSEGDVVVLNLPGLDDGAPLSLGLRGLDVRLGDAGTPGGAPGQGTAQRAQVRAVAFDPREPEATLATLEGSLTPADPLDGLKLLIGGLDARRADRWLGRPGLFEESVGESLSVEVLSVTPPAGADRAAALEIRSPRLKASGELVQRAGATALSRPLTATWEMPASWGNRYLLPPAPDGRPAPLALSAPIALTLRVDRLSIGGDGRPMAPGVFALESTFSAPRVALRTGEGDELSFTGLDGSVRSSRPGAVGFDFVAKAEGGTRGGEAPRGAVEGAAPAPEGLTVRGELTNLADADGAMVSGQARLSMTALGTVPTAVVDALAQYQGLLVDLLGPTTRLDLEARDLSKETGSVRAQVDTDYARGRVAGRIEGGAFVADQDVTASLTRITPALSARALEQILPLIARVEKTQADEPASLVASGLTLPTGGDLTKLNGVIRVDPGTVQFQTSDVLGQLLKAGKQAIGGRAGERLKPFEFQVRQGVVSYERIELPLGEFSLVAKGVVDLPRKRMDLVTFVPFSALAEELAGTVGRIPGLSRLAMIPVRTRGSLDNPKSEVALELIVEEGLPGAIEEGVGKALDDLLKGLGGKKK